MRQFGALPDFEIKNFILQKSILNAREENIQPGSIDLSVSDKVYRVRSGFLPRTEERIEDLLSTVDAVPYNFEYPLELDVTYLVKLNEEFVLPKDVYGYANPKSSVGRNDVCVNMVADYIARFDSLGVKGYRGTTWALIKPKSFPIRLSPGETLLQLRLFRGDARLSHDELKALYKKERLLFNTRGEEIPFEKIKISDRDGGLILGVDLRSDIVGWRCERQQKILDFSKRNYYAPEDFFEPIYRPKNGVLTLRQGDFYIFYTRQWIRVPSNYAAEIVPVDVRNGEYRSHYAGFFDPGWGYGRRGEILGKPGVLEVRPFEDNIILRDGQPVAKFVFERMTARPKLVYGETGSHYHKQTGPRLSKHFNVTEAGLSKKKYGTK